MSPLATRSGALMLALRSLRQHALSTSVTVVSVALGAGLVMSIFSINQQVYDAFVNAPVGFDAVLGARGSKLQLVLNAVFHLEASPGNVPWSLYEKLRGRPAVALAVPYALGDSLHGFRIVGTTTDLFEKYKFDEDRALRIRSGGRLFDPQTREAVVGSYVAQKTGLAVGARFFPYHGVSLDEHGDEEHEHKKDEYLVVGVLEPSGTPMDRVVWIPIEGQFRMAGHKLRGTGHDYEVQPGQPIPDEAKEISAVLLKFKSPGLGAAFNDEINTYGKTATLAWPISAVMVDLFNKLGWANRVLQVVAYLVVVVAAAAILAVVYNSINERRRDFAILRALGARRRLVFASIVLESAAIAALGALLGYVVYGLIVAAAADVLWRQAGVVLHVLAGHPALWLTPLGMVALGAVAGVLPAIKAYSVDVATNLTPVS